ncbi:MAG: 3-methyl-2-oxobutanoate dehydrogenase subunit VorB [Elusimicrobiaceae bacterium]|nr:3-methyl-2-oxobutanoate dehydrogenase subunit VorB [Elusimicrobiaceae bacterium]
MGEKTLMKGNEALAEGAIRAGCRFFAGYPITPQNEIPEYFAWRQPEVNGVFVQAESETAAINMLYGAAATGVRTMTSSSSPGISLKAEGISYCAGADLPIFFANIVRGGPGLGNIAGAQGDYFQAVKGGGHGDYRVITLAPNTVQEMGNFPMLAYELAEKYRVPAMILADGILGQMMEPVSFEKEPVDAAKLPVPDWALGNCAGRAKRLVNSYDLREGELEKLINARARRYAEIEKNEARWEERDTGDADIILVAYGTSSRACLEALHCAREKRLKVGLFRPITLWPFPSGQLARAAKKAKAVLTVEMSLGQMVEDVRLAVNGAVPVHLHARPGGGVPTGAEIIEQAGKILAGKQCDCGCGCGGDK